MIRHYKVFEDSASIWKTLIEFLQSDLPKSLRNDIFWLVQKKIHSFLKDSEEASQELDRLESLVIKSEVFSQGIEDHLFRILPYERLSEIQQIASQANIEEIVTKMHDTIKLVEDKSSSLQPEDKFWHDLVGS